MGEIPHTLSEFEEGLKRSKSDLLQMASVAIQNLENALNGLLTRDRDLCNEAIVEDETVNRLELKIYERGMEILTRFQPVAIDLRLVIGAIRISTNLERISDLAENIARRSLKILKKSEVSEVILVEPIYHYALELVRDSIKAFADGDTKLAASLHARDVELDEHQRKAIKRLTDVMENDAEFLRVYLNLIYIIRSLERVGDHAVNIGEDSVFVYDAIDIRHPGLTADSQRSES